MRAFPHDKRSLPYALFKEGNKEEGAAVYEYITVYDLFIKEYEYFIV